MQTAPWRLTELQREILCRVKHVGLRVGTLEGRGGVGGLDELADELVVEDAHFAEDRQCVRHVDR